MRISQFLFNILQKKKVLETFLLSLGKHTSNIIFLVNTERFYFKREWKEKKWDENICCQKLPVSFYSKTYLNTSPRSIRSEISQR